MKSFLTHLLTAAALTGLRNVKDSRFFAALTIVLMVTATGSFLSERQTEQSFREYAANRDNFLRSANLETVKLALRPSPLSFLSDGGGDRLPRYLVVTPGFLDQPIEDVTRNPVRAFQRLDWTFIVSYFFSFLTLLLTFDFISGQRESGTLALTLAGGAPRLAVLLGGLLGTLATVVPCLLAGLALFLLPATFNGLLVASWEGLVRVGLTAVMSIALMTVMALAGLLCSAISPRAGSSLTLAFLFWAATTLILPQAARIAGHLVVPVQSLADFRAEVGSERARYLSRLASFSSMDIRDRISGAGAAPALRERAIAQFQSAITENNTRAIESFRSNVSRLRRDYLQRIDAREQFIRRLQAISPVELHRFGVDDLCGVGRNRFRTFREGVRRYLDVYTAYAKRQRERLRAQAKFEGAVITEGGYSVRSVSWLDYAGVDFQRRSLPAFEQPETPVSEAVGQALDKFLALAVMAFVLFAAAAQAFARLEP